MQGLKAGRHKKWTKMLQAKVDDNPALRKSETAFSQSLEETKTATNDMQKAAQAFIKRQIDSSCPRCPKKGHTLKVCEASSKCECGLCGNEIEKGEECRKCFKGCKYVICNNCVDEATGKGKMISMMCAIQGMVEFYIMIILQFIVSDADFEDEEEVAEFVSKYTEEIVFLNKIFDEDAELIDEDEMEELGEKVEARGDKVKEIFGGSGKARMNEMVKEKVDKHFRKILGEELPRADSASDAGLHTNIKTLGSFIPKFLFRFPVLTDVVRGTVVIPDEHYEDVLDATLEYAGEQAKKKRAEASFFLRKGTATKAEWPYPFFMAKVDLKLESLTDLVLFVETQMVPLSIWEQKKKDHSAHEDLRSRKVCKEMEALGFTKDEVNEMMEEVEEMDMFKDFEDDDSDWEGSDSD